MRLFILLLLPNLICAIGLDEQGGVCRPIPPRLNNGQIVYSEEPTNGKFRWNTTARVECDDGYVSDGKFYEEVTCYLYDELYGDFDWRPTATAIVGCKPEESTLASRVSKRIENFYDDADLVEKAFMMKVLRRLSKHIVR